MLLFASAQAEHDTAAYVPDPADLEEREKAKVTSRAALGEDKWRTAWERGYRLSIDRAMALALLPPEVVKGL